MGLFSFGKKDELRSRRIFGFLARLASYRPYRAPHAPYRSDRDADAMMLDPTLPEKQRARRRLVGAIALVLAAVIVLPMVLDSRPKPVTDDISIDIPNRPAPAAKQSRDANDADTQAGVAHDATRLRRGLPNGQCRRGRDASRRPSARRPPAGASEACNPARTKPKRSPKRSRPETCRGREPDRKAGRSPPKKQSEHRRQPAAGAANTPSSPAGSRFVLQIGQFDDETAAQNWVNKLKSAGVPAYLEHRKQSDGATQIAVARGAVPGSRVGAGRAREGAAGRSRRRHSGHRTKQSRCSPVSTTP